MKRRAFLGIVVAVQVLCAGVFVWEIAVGVFGLAAQPIDWHIHELIELGAALGLVLGVAFGGYALRVAVLRTERAERALKAASGAFMELLETRFTEWGLTPAERDVALFAIKGMTIQEIAQLRSTSEGTVKAQTNAIYRKAGVNGRPQLLSLFIEDLVEKDA